MRISFDLWGTLIKGNPNIAPARAQLIREFSDIPNKDLLNDHFIKDRMAAIKTRHDTLVEHFGTQPDNMHLFAEVCDTFSISPRNFTAFYHEYQATYKKFLPQIYCDKTLETLWALKRDGHELNICSNTLFVATDTMLNMIEAVLESDENLFTFARYSIVNQRSKPHPSMFLTRCQVHVGDNILTDGASIKAGIPFYQINTNDKTITDFYEAVTNSDIFCTPVQQ